MRALRRRRSAVKALKKYRAPGELECKGLVLEAVRLILEEREG